MESRFGVYLSPGFPALDAWTLLACLVPVPAKSCIQIMFYEVASAEILFQKVSCIPLSKQVEELFVI